MKKVSFFFPKKSLYRDFLLLIPGFINSPLKFSVNLSIIKQTFAQTIADMTSTPTIIDVAKLAGVSTTTVSHIINGTRYVSDDLKERVEKAIDELGYRPNNLARGLRRGESKTIGLIVPDNSNQFFAEILRQIENIGFANGYSVILCNSDGDGEKEASYTDLLITKQVDGIILIATNNSTEHLMQLIQNNIPIIIVDRDIDLKATDVLLVNNFQGGYEATRYLIGLGHNRIACITGPSLLTPSMERVNGYKRAMEEASLSVSADWIIPGDFMVEGGEAAIKRLLELDSRPTAIFACNDMMAMGVMRGLKGTGYSIPTDFSLIGFDNISMASIVSPALTSVAQPIDQISERAIALLFNRIHNNTSDLPSERIVLPTKLVIRETCKELGAK